MAATAKNLRSESQRDLLTTQPKDFAWLKPAVRLGDAAKQLKSGCGKMKGETELTLQGLLDTEHAEYLARRIEADPQLEEPLWRTRSLVSKMQSQRETMQKSQNEVRASRAKAELSIKEARKKREECVNHKQAEQKLESELKAANMEKARLEEEKQMMQERLQDAHSRLQATVHTNKETNRVVVNTQCFTPRSEVSTTCGFHSTSSASVSSLTPRSNAYAFGFHSTLSTNVSSFSPRSNAPVFGGYPLLLGQASQMHPVQASPPSHKLLQVPLPMTIFT